MFVSLLMQMLNAAFAQFGTIERAVVACDMQSNKSRRCLTRQPWFYLFHFLCSPRKLRTLEVQTAHDPVRPSPRHSHAIRLAGFTSYS